MFLIERSVLPPRSNPGSNPGSTPRTVENPLSDGAAARTPPVPATFLESAAGGAFELFPRRQFQGPGDLVRASLPDPLMAGLARAEAPFHAVAPLPPLPALPLPAAQRLRRRA